MKNPQKVTVAKLKVEIRNQFGYKVMEVVIGSEEALFEDMRIKIKFV